MPNEILIKVRVDNADVSPGLAKTLAEVRTFGDGLAAEMDAAGRKAGEKAGNEVAGSLNRQLRELRLPEIDIHANAAEAEAKIKETEFSLKALAGDNPTIEVKVKTDKALGDLDKLKAHFREFESSGHDSGGGWAGNFLKSAGEKIGGGEGMSSILIPLGAALAPLLASSVAGAIVGGVGIGGIAGGLLLASKDARVQSALGDLKTNVQTHLKSAIEPFVGEAVQGVHQVDHALAGINFKGIFADLAPQIAPLINGVTDLISRLGGAIENIAKNSGPVIAAIGQEIGDLGTVLADGLNMLSDNSKQEAEGLKDLFSIINGGIEVTFELVNALTEVYGIFHKMFELSIPGAFELISEKQRTVKGSAVEMAQAIIQSTKATDESTTSTELATAALKAQDDAIHQVANSLKASTDPLFAFMDAQDSLTQKEDAMNKAIKTNGQNSKEAKAATHEYQKALIDYISAAAGATNGTGHLTNQQRQLLASAGTSKKRIDELDASLYAAWKQANKLDNFNVDVTVATHFKQFGKPYSDMNPYQFHGLAHGGIQGAASGTTSSGLTWTGEQGPELLDLPPGTSVRTAGDSKRAMQASGGSGGATSVMVMFDKAGLTGLAAAIVETLRAEIRYGGGNVQQYLGVPGK